MLLERPTALSGTDRSETAYCVVPRSFSRALSLRGELSQLDEATEARRGWRTLLVWNSRSLYARIGSAAATKRQKQETRTLADEEVEHGVPVRVGDDLGLRLCERTARPGTSHDSPR